MTYHQPGRPACFTLQGIHIHPLYWKSSRLRFRGKRQVINAPPAHGGPTVFLQLNEAVRNWSTVHVTIITFKLSVTFYGILQCNFERGDTPSTTGFSGILPKSLKMHFAFKNISRIPMNVYETTEGVFWTFI